MSEPVPPTSLPLFDLSSFHITLNEHANQKIASALGHKRKVLSIDETLDLEHLIAVYRAAVNEVVGAGSTTVGATIAAIDESLRALRDCEDKLARFTNERSGVDVDTFDALHAHAIKCREATNQFKSAAELRKTKLEALKRVKPATEALRHFCAMLRHFFRKYASPAYKVGGSTAQVRKFALVVLLETGVEHSDFIDQPKRLDEYLNTFIPLQDLPGHWLRIAKKIEPESA